MAETSRENNKAISNINDKFLELLIDRGTLASHLLSLLLKITNLEYGSKLKLIEKLVSERVNDL